MSDRLRTFLLRALTAAAGIGLLVAVLMATDLGEVGTYLERVGWGVVLMIAAYKLAFVLDSWAWLLTFRSLPGRVLWVWRLWLVRMVGEAVNNATPFAGMGGEPVKAAILNRRWGIGYGEGLASIVLARTTFVLGLVPFLAIGIALLLFEPGVSAPFKWAAAGGLALLSFGIFAFFGIQRLRIASRSGGWLAGFLKRRGLDDALENLAAFEDRLVSFYAHARLRFSGTVLLSFFNWALGALEVWIAFRLLGAPVGFGEAWIIEAVVQLVRVGVFFVPLSLGTQEGAFVLVVGALTGNPELGVAAAVLRRFRELVVLGAGLLMGPLVFGRGAFRATPERPS